MKIGAIRISSLEQYLQYTGRKVQRQLRVLLNRLPVGQRFNRQSSQIDYFSLPGDLPVA
jgi:hypothetical protein